MGPLLFAGVGAGLNCRGEPVTLNLSVIHALLVKDLFSRPTCNFARNGSFHRSAPQTQTLSPSTGPHEQSKEAEIRGTTVRECFAVHRPSGASTTSETPSHGFRVPLRRDAPRLATTLDPLRVIPTEPACLTRGTSRMSGRSFGCVAGCGSTNSRLIPLWPTRR